MQQGFETFTSHTFREYCAISLGAHGNAIINFIRKNPRARVLDVGCGDGAALDQLREVCEAEGFLGVTFFGLDEKRSEKLPGNISFTCADIGNKHTANLREKFDLIISVNTLHYVKDKIKALENIATLLSPNGIAYISIEPYYFGPHGVSLFNGSNCCSWDNDFRNIVVRSQANPVVIADKNLFEYDFPLQLDALIFRNRDNKQVTVPAYYTDEILRGLKQEGGLDKELGRAAFWDLLAFLNCRTPNLNGTDECGVVGYRPFRFGVVKKVWLLQENLPKFGVIRILTDRFVWDTQSLRPGFVPSELYLELVGRLFELHGKDYIADRKKFDSLADMECFYKGNRNFVSKFNNKNTLYIIGGLLVIIGIMLKIMARMSGDDLSSSSNLGLRK